MVNVNVVDVDGEDSKTAKVRPISMRNCDAEIQGTAIIKPAAKEVVPRLNKCQWGGLFAATHEKSTKIPTKNE